MSFKTINDKWKNFLNENTFKEDKIIPRKKKKSKKRKILQGEELEMKEELDEASGMSGGSVEGCAGSKEDELDESFLTAVLLNRKDQEEQEKKKKEAEAQKQKKPQPKIPQKK